MSHLSSAKWDIELDLSNYYWQNAIPIEDSAKLAVCHPYIGLCVMLFPLKALGTVQNGDQRFWQG